MSLAGWVVVALGGVAAAVVACEITLRRAAYKLHPLTEWQNWEMHHKVSAVNELACDGGASVVAVGSSMINAAIDPYYLSALLQSDRPVFNAGLNGAGTRLLERWTLDVVLPRLRPDLVVIGFGSHELSHGNLIARRLLDSLLTSRAWGELRGGGSVWDRVKRWAERRSFLVRYRRYLGRRKLFRDTPSRRSSTCRRLGMPRALLLFRFRQYRIDDRQLTIWNQLLAEFDIGTEEIAALGRLIAGVRAAGAIPILVRMPVTKDWVNMHPRGQADFETFQRAVSSFAYGHDVVYADLAGRLHSIEYHADPVHLNGEGLREFTALLAKVIHGRVPRPERSSTE
jgi:hypothetical protein